MALDPERLRLAEDAARTLNWKRWGPYQLERQWGTVREDYSPDGSCWGSCRTQQKQVSNITVQVDAARLADANRQNAENAGITTSTLGEQVRELDSATRRLRGLIGTERDINRPEAAL